VEPGRAWEVSEERQQAKLVEQEAKARGEAYQTEEDIERVAANEVAQTQIERRKKERKENREKKKATREAEEEEERQQQAEDSRRAAAERACEQEEDSRRAATEHLEKERRQHEERMRAAWQRQQEQTQPGMCGMPQAEQQRQHQYGQQQQYGQPQQYGQQVQQQGWTVRQQVAVERRWESGGWYTLQEFVNQLGPVQGQNRWQVAPRWQGR
jgi:hypothetical protein